MNAVLEQINSMGKAFVEFAVPMLVQSGVLIVILLLIDLALRKKVKAVFRYCIWMLVLVKLVLPTSLSSPLSLGYWFGDHLAYVAESRTAAAPEAEAEEPALANMLHIIEPVPVEVERPAPAVLPMMPDVEPAVTEAVSPPAAPVTPVTWQGVVFLLWLAVVIALGLLLLQRAMFVRGLVAQAKEANALMNDALEYCCKCMGVKRKVGLKVSANAASPAVCGLFRPVILLPHKLAPSLGSRGLRAVLLHELAHIRRGDLWVNLAQTVLQIMYFYNPLLWVANAMIRRVREQAIDETVLVRLRRMGEKAQQYPQTLVNVAKLAFKRPVLSLRLIGVVESKSALAGRIKHILGRPMPKSAKIGIVGVLAVIIAGAILLPMAKGSWGQKAPIGKLVEKLKSKDDAVWKPAAEQLKKIGPKAARQVAELFRTVPGDNHAIRVLKSMATDKHVQDVMVQGLSAGPHSNVRHCSLIILAESGNREHVGKIIPLFQKDIETGRNYSMAGNALGRLGGDEAYNALIEGLTKKIPDQLRWIIAEHLAEMGRVEAIPYLKDTLKFVDPLHSSAGTRIVSAIHRLEDKNEIAEKPYPNLYSFTLREFDSGYSQRGILYAYDLQRADNASAYVDKPPAGANAEETMFGNLRALAAGSKGDLIFERVGEQTRLQAYHGTLLAPLEVKTEPPHHYWTDAVGKMHQSELKQLVLDYNNKHAKGIAGPIPGFRLYPFDEGDSFAAVLPSGQIAILATKKIESYTSGVYLNVLYLDPLLALVGTARIEASQDSAADADKSQFIATLPNGVRVELVGVCEHPSEGKQWWRPDGTMLPEAPYEKTNSYTDPKDDNDFEIAFRFGGYLLDDINLAWKRIPGAINGTVAYGSALVDDKRVPDFVTITASFPKNQNTVTIPLGVAAGSWKSFAITDGRGERSTSAGDKVVRFEAAYQKEAKTYLMVWHNFYDAVARLIAIDTSGKPQIGNEVEGGIGKGVEGYKYAFEVPLKEITTFQFQTRPYDWVEFKNVSLRPGVKTDVQVEGEEITDSNLFWGEEANGLRAAIEFIPEKESYSLGETINYQVNLQNVSDKTIQIARDTGYTDPGRWIIQDSEGAKIICMFSKWHGTGGVDRRTLEPGEETTLKFRAVALGKMDNGEFAGSAERHAYIKKPGRYFFHYQLRFYKKTEGDWSGTLETGKRKLVLTSTAESDQKPTVQVEGETPDEKAGLVWGKAVQGVQVGITVAKTKWRIGGDVPRVNVEVRISDPKKFQESGLETKTLAHDWSAFALEIDGKQYKQNVEYTTEPGPLQSPFKIVLSLDDQWQGGLYGQPWLSPGRHKIRVLFVGLGMKVASEPVEIEVLPDDKKLEPWPHPWGKAVRGVQVSAHPAQPSWPVGSEPVIRICLRNQGKEKWSIHERPSSFAVEVDGKRYENNFIFHVWRRPFALGDIYQFDLKLSKSKPFHDGLRKGNSWPRVGKPPPLLAGKHTIRVLFTELRIEPEPASQPVEIEIVPAEEKPAVQIQEIKRIDKVGPGQSAETNKGQILINYLVADVYVEIDRETRIEVDGIMGRKINSNDELKKTVSAPDILREAVQNRKITEDKFRDLIDLLGERGYLRILCAPKLLLNDNRTGKIQTNDKNAAAGGTVSLEATAHILEDGFINLETKLILGAKSVQQGSERRVPIVSQRKITNMENRIKSGQRVIIGGIKRTEKRSVVRDKTTDFEERIKETLVIVTPTIIKAEDIPLGKIPRPDVQVEGEEGWGEAVEGLQVRLQANKTAWRMGETPTFSLDLRNSGKKTFAYVKIMEAHCRIEYDDQWYIWADPIMIGAPEWPLRPGVQANGAIKVKLVKSWGITMGGKERLELTPGRHTVRVLFNPDGPEGQAVSNPVEIEILAAGVKPAIMEGVKQIDVLSWGEAVEGVQCRLRADKQIWKTNETVTFKADIRNQGNERWWFGSIGPERWKRKFCEVEFDGKWHSWPYPASVHLPDGVLHENHQFNDVLIPLDERLGVNVTPGRHVVRVAFFPAPGNPKSRVVGKPVEIEILPAEEKPAVEVEGAKGYRTRHFVRIVVGKDKMTFKGEETSWEELPQLLQQVPEREKTVLELALASTKMTIAEKNETSARAATMQKQFGFDYFSYVGIHPLGTKGGPSHVTFEGQLEFKKKLPISLRSADGLVRWGSVEFSTDRDYIKALLILGIISYPKAEWEVRVRLLDSKARQLSSAYQTIENSGFVLSGKTNLAKQTLTFSLGKAGIVNDAKTFEIRIRQLPAGTKTDVQVEGEVKGGGLTVFESYFPDDAEAGKKLDQWWENRRRNPLDDEEFFELFRKGLRRSTVEYKGNFLMQHIGGGYIWHKDPDDQRAIDIVYHASFSPEYKYYAVYSGLSVANPKSEKVLKRLVDLAMETDDYRNVTGRILWGCRNQKDELIAYLEPYLNSDDETVRQKARDVKDYFMDSKAFMAKRAKEHEESVRQEYGDKLVEFKEQLLNGNSQSRMDTLKQLQSKGIMSIVDESFIDVFGACTKDSDPEVRTKAARMMGGKFIWKGESQNQQAIEILTELLDDLDRSTRKAAVYYGLSTVLDPSKELVRKMLATILDDREINYYGRVIWGIRRNKQACVEILKEWMYQSEQASGRALKAYEIYEDVSAQQLPEEYAQRFAGQKSDAHEGLVAMCFQANPVSKEELQKQFFELLTNSNQIQKVLDFYIIIESRETAVGMFICDNLSDRNAIRSALAKDGLFQVAGYMHGKIGLTGSGWIDSLKRFRIRNELNRVSLPKPDARVEGEMTGAEAGIEGRIRAVIDKFWAAVEADDFGRVRQLSQIDMLEKRGALGQTLLEQTLKEVNEERKQLLSRGFDISKIMDVHIRGDEAVAVGKANKSRLMWYYLEKGPDGWLIKLFDDAPQERTIEEIFTQSRGHTGKTAVQVEAAKKPATSGESKMVPAAKSELQRLIDSARPGAVIRIGPGVYEERLNINKPLTLEGAGWDRTTIMTRNDAAAKSEEQRRAIRAELKEKYGIPTLLVSNTDEVVIRDLKFTSPGRRSGPIVKFSNAKALLSGCAVVGTPADGIHILDGSDVEIRNCLVAAVWRTGIAVAGGTAETTKARIIDSDVRNCRHRCITIGRGGGSTVVERCRISGSAWHGIRYDHTSPTITNNLIFGNARFGIYASGTTAAIVKQNVFYGNEMAGMSCWFQNQDTIEGNTFADNKRSGLEVLGTSKPIVRKNIFFANPRGVFCGNIGSDSAFARFDGVITLEGNLFWDNESKAVWRGVRTAESESTAEELSLGEQAHNIEADPRFTSVEGKDFSLMADSPAWLAGIGVADPIKFKSRWPLQPEEIAIIPDGETRDSGKWKKQARGTPVVKKPATSGESKMVSAAKSELQRLIDSARAGDTVIVPKGVYTEPIEINKSLTLKGQSRAACVFEVTADKPAIFIDTKGKGRVTIEAVTIKWQLATSDRSEYHFAVGVKDSKAEVKNCSFVPLGNFKRSPVAIQAIGFSNLTINTCRFEGFEYTVCYGEGTEGTIQDSLVMGSGHQGISLYSGATVKIIRNVVTGSKYHGVRSTGGTLDMKDNLIIENANRGVYLGNKSAHGTITNNIITGNRLVGISGFAQSDVKIYNNLILNSGQVGIGAQPSCRFLVKDNIIKGSPSGIVVFLKEGARRGNLLIRRNTFWNNETDTENCEKAPQSISEEPAFRDPANGDFSLTGGKVMEQKQGLTDPKVFKALWKRWKNRAAKPDVQVEFEEAGKVSVDAVDVAVKDFKIRPYEAGGLYVVTVAIQNNSKVTAPAFRLNFYHGDPANNLNLHGKPQTGSHGAGPIKSGDVWNEGSMPFALKEGVNEIVVVLDPDNAVVESDETNNCASIKVIVKDGRIIEKSVSYSAQESKGTARIKTEVEVEVEVEPTVSKLLTALQKNEKYVHIREPIVEMVEEIGDKEPISFLVEQLQSENRRRRCDAALALELLGDRRGVPAIIKELNDTSYRPTTRIKSDGREYQEGQIRQDHYYAALLLGILGDERAVPALIEATWDETINYQAAISLGEIGDKSAVPTLRAMLERLNKPSQRLWAGYGLAMLSDEEGLKVVIDTLNNREQQWVIRRHAIEALGELGDKQAVPHLIAALKDDHPNIRVSAARALGAIGDASALPALEEALKDKTETEVNAPTTVSKAAAEAIAQIKAGDGQKTDVQVEVLTDKTVELDIGETVQQDVKRQYPIILRWPLIKDASKYVIQIRGIRGSRPAKSYESVTNWLQLEKADIPPGRYQWSVSVYDENGTFIGEIENTDPMEYFAIEDIEPVEVNGKKVLIDLNHSAGHVRGWGYYNHAQYMTKELLENAGFEVEINERDLLTAERLKSADLLICHYYWAGWPGFRPYLKSELSAVRQFVEKGGSLLVVGCDRKDGGGKMCEAGNELVEEFGFKFDLDEISEQHGQAERAPDQNVISFNKPIGIQLAVGVNAEDAATILQFEGIPIVKAKQYGNGKIIIAGVGMSFLDCYIGDFERREPLHLIMFYDFIRYLTGIDWKEHCKKELVDIFSLAVDSKKAAEVLSTKEEVKQTQEGAVQVED